MLIVNIFYLNALRLKSLQLPFIMNITLADIASLAKEYYSLQVQVKALTGEYELNYMLTATGGERYILKLADTSHSYEFFDAQVKMLHHLANSPAANYFYRCLPANNGGYLTTVLLYGHPYYMRLLTCLPGDFWIDLPEHPAHLYTELGQLLGNMDKALQNFAHPAMHRHYLWDISQATAANRKLHCIANHERRRIAGYFLLQFEMEVLPKLSTLRHAYAHHDANDTNILVNDNHVTGLIDFSDMVYTALINNVAVACTYAMMHRADPLHAACLVVQGYHQAYPLQREEVDLLYYLVAARLCISVAQSAYNASIETNNVHHFVSEKPAWDLLYKLIRINPLKAQHALRLACGFEGVLHKDGYEELLQRRSRHIGKNLSISYHDKLKIVRGALQYLYDDKGDTYVDCVNNPSHVGHCHPVVVRRMQHQLATLNTNTRYLHDDIVAYAERLTATLPSKLSVCYFTNSGSEANDLAVRIARHYTGNKDLIVLDHAYHGTSTVAIEMSPYKFDGKGGFGQMPWVHKAQNPDTYRGPYREADAGVQYARDVQRIIDQLAQEGKKPALFICETLLGVGGQMPLPPGYLAEVYRLVRQAGGVCIADEVQVGFGRVGNAFWGFQLQEVEPDIVVMGKPIGNGHPLAAVVVTQEIADAFNNGMEYFNTFGGNPVSMATGLAVLDVIQQEDMQQHAKETGEYLMAGLRKLAEKHAIIGDVRGHGLFIGAELVKSRTTLEPAVPEIDAIVEYVRNRGYLLSTDGPLHNVLKIKPPLTFNKTNADELIALLDEAIGVVC